jgi:FHS family L-fucose permease-like MFS transporter
MPPAGPAAYRLQFSQSWNGVASFVGPLIASKFFFSGGNENNLDNVQWVYLAVSGMGIILAVTFFFVRLPEVSEADLQAEVDALAESPAAIAAADQLAKPFIRQTRPMLGFLAQFMYVGAQVAIGALFINYCLDAGMSKPQASNFLSYALIIFTVGRFISTALLTVISAPALLMINAVLAAVFIAVVSSTRGMGGVGCLMVVYFLMACMYPVIFVISTANLGRHTRRAASLLVAGVSGGAVLTPIQGAIATYYNTHVSFWVSFPAFLYVAFFGFYCWRTQSGSAWTRSGEIAHQVALANGGIIPPQKTALDLEGGSNDGDEKKTLETEEFQVERVERN